MKKRIFALLLAFIMLVGMLPVNAFATEVTEPGETTVVLCETEGCEYASGHEGNCSNYVAPTEPCTTEGCTYGLNHEGNCSNYVACETEGCEYTADHEGNCSNYVAATEPCTTEGCTYGAGHEGNCSNFVACATEGCEYASGHEGNCSNFVEPTADELAAMAVIDPIDAIGTVTLESEAAISAADTAYNALTDEQKALVTNLDVLEAAKTAYAALSTPAPAAYQGAIIYEYGVTDSSKVPNALGYFNRVLLDGVQNVNSVVWTGDKCEVLLDSSTAKNATITFVVELAGSRATNSNTKLTINSVGASADASDASIKIGSVTLENGEQTALLKLSVMTSSKTKTINLKVAEDGDAAPTVPVESITLDKDSLSLTAGTSETLIATVGPENATNKTVTWISDKEAVATVADGVVTAVAAGTATITAKAGDKTDICVVTVTAAEEPDTPPTENVPVEIVALSEASIELVVGKSETLTASVGPENATDKTVTWTSSDEAVAKVDENGIVTAVAAGTATITAKAGEITASCKVTVIENLPALSALKFSAGSAATSVEYALEPAFDPAVREYTVIVPDNSTQFWAWATLGEGLTNNPKIIIKYFNTSGKETTKNITSGAAKGVSIGSFLKTGHDVKELSVLIADETAYTVKVVRKSQLKGINLSSNGSEVPLTPAFSNTTTEYSATVAYDKELTLGATATFSTSTFTVNGQPVDAVNKAATVSFIPQWDENMSSVVTVVAGSSVEGARPTEYTIKLSQRATKIEIQTPSDKREYKPGDKFDPTGMTLLATYSDGSTKTITPDHFSYSPTEELSPAVTEVTISYDSLTVTQPIKVADAFKGIGTAEDPYLIESADDLVKLSELVASGVHFKGEFIKMVNDIELPSGWTPVGSSTDARFKGTFDGGGKLLTVPAGGLPLFGYVGGATIKNLNVYGTQIAGYGLINHFDELDENAADKGVSISRITLKSGSSTLKSGLLGSEFTTNPYAGSTRSSEAHISGCTIESGVVIGYNGDQNYIGSIAGRMQGSITGCTSNATVKGVNYVGGILGSRDNGLGTCSISGCSFGGSVSASGNQAGGILGGGYTGTVSYEASAPNGDRTSVTGCTVTGSVSGVDRVGGIIGGDNYVAQTWSANEIKNNQFTGTISASGSYVGGIVGYYNSLNKFDNIANNYYSGASKGIGFVQYIDTSCTTHETASGAIYFDTGSDTKNYPDVYGCWWEKNHNRTDDPLGADAAKLCYTDVKGLTLSDLELAVGGNTIDTAAVQTLSPAFAGSTTEYSTPILDYESDKNNRFVWVKVSAPEGATVTAECGGSEVATLVSGQWGVLQVKGGYFWSPTYSGCLTPGEYNKVEITVSKEGETDKVYTVMVPMQPDIANRSLAWKTNLSDALYITKNDENAALTVEAQYKNRPLENEDVVTYQWYSNTSATTEGGTAIAGATAATYVPDISKLGTGYYYAVASCKDLESITSKVITVTVTDEAAPKSISIVCDYPYTVPNDWGKALGGVSFVAKIGDTLTLKAVDENGKETPVVWPSSLGGGSLNVTNGSTVVYTVTSTIYSYVQVTSLYDSTIQSEEKAIQVEDYSVNQYNKTPTVTLSDDGQSAKSISVQGGLNGYTIWSYTVSPENAAELSSDQKEKANYLKFNALRPGTIQASFDLDLNGDGVADGNGQTDTATLTINGIAVEDSSGNLTKTYLESSTAKPNPTMQLKALSSTENPVFTWSSADETVATVDENGVITAKGVGSVIISSTDGTYTGGIKVVVTSADTPYFESIDFVTTSAWSNGLSNASWKTADFKATTLQYTGLKLTKAAASTLTLKDTTLYNTEKYTASAAYVDANGTEQSVVIHSGAATELKNLPFETNIITITLTDKADETKKTVYTFEVTRPRDTTKTIANNGIVFVPDGREIWKDKYDGKTEGIMYVANEDGSFAQYQGVSSSRLYYRTYALNGLESFSLTLKGSSAFTHIRVSTDDGATWKYLGQTGASGVSTGKLAIPAPTGEEHSVVKVTVQILDDVTYAANVAAGKDGFADSEPKAYTLWVEQIPAPVVACDIETAVTDIGDWYPTFHKDRTNYRILVAPEAEAPVLIYTVSEGAKVSVGGVEQTPDEKGEYTLTLTSLAQEILVSASDGMTNKAYSFGYSERESIYVPDKVVDFLTVNSQYINGNAGGYGVNPQQTLTGGLLSLGNFGGYVTFYMENGLTDDPGNAYGVDFYVNGNAFQDVSTGTGLGSMEPGQVWVSENGSTWYALAGSEHYESSTIWNYSVTYTKTETGGTDWKDNYGNTMASTHGRSFAWPSPDVYTMNDLPKQSSFTLTGILLPCVDGTITGTDNFNAFSKGGRYGYVDLLPNGTSNPYLANSDYSNASSGFDLKWAVDAAGNPVDVTGKSFHYVKVVTASNLMAGSANEKSTEVGNLVRATSKGNAVGVTAAPSGVTISSGDTSKKISFEAGQQVYEMDLGDMEYVSILVNGTANSDNIYVNNQRVSSGTAATGIKISGTQRLVRIIVQNGEKEPVIYLLKLSRSTEVPELIDSVKITVDGAGRLAQTSDGKVYTAEVGYRVDSIGIAPNVVSGVEVKIDEESVKDKYPLKEGENSFTITAAKDGVTQTVTLKVTKEKKPASTGKITVSFTLLGDTKHGSGGTPHTLYDGNLTTWLAKKDYELDSPATVVDLIDLALKGKYSFVNSGGNYISSVNGLSEFDNGPNSGWMYTINGYHSQQGVAEQQLKDGDTVVLHYSDDWTLEHSQNTGSDDPAVKNVEDLINAIGTVTLDSKAKIDAARKAYDGLTAQQKQKVGNYGVLLAAEKKYAQLKKDADEAAAKRVEDMIDTLDSNSATFEENVKAAKKAYDALTADQKKLVGNYQKLADTLKKLASEADKKAAEAVEKLIDAIGTVTKDSEAAIKAAREAYDKLTDEQKALVGNLATLEAAEEKLAALKTLVGIEDIYKATGDYLEKLGTPVPGTVGGEWMVIGLIRSGREVPDAYYDNAVKFVQENIDENGRLHSAKSTENARMILALTAIGKDVTNVGGHNLLSGLTDMTYVQKQGINGPIWALIAFDSGNYPIPEGGNVTREALIQVILDAQLSDGGWALSGSTSDADITGMALQALAPYYKTDAKVKAAVDETLETLSVMQTADGSFGSIDGVSAESIAQVVAGLSALGIDVHTDARFIKNGVSTIDALCAFYVEGGGFKHIPDGNLDGMATEQGYYALAAYFRMLEGKTALYDMTDVIDMGGDVTVEEPVETLPAETESAPTEPVEIPAENDRSFPWWLVIVIVVLAGAIVVLVIISGPKKGRHMK